LTFQLKKISEYDNDYDRGVETLRYLIKSWSFVDGDEKPLEITPEILGRLPQDDFTFLMDEVTKTFEKKDLKKKKS